MVRPDPGFPRAVRVRDERGVHDGYVLAARRDPVTGRWRGFVDYTDRTDHRTGGHYLHWVDQDRIMRRSQHAESLSDTVDAEAPWCS